MKCIFFLVALILFMGIYSSTTQAAIIHSPAKQVDETSIFLSKTPFKFNSFKVHTHYSITPNSIEPKIDLYFVAGSNPEPSVSKDIKKDAALRLWSFSLGVFKTMEACRSVPSIDAIKAYESRNGNTFSLIMETLKPYPGWQNSYKPYTDEKSESIKNKFLSEGCETFYEQLNSEKLDLHNYKDYLDDYNLIKSSVKAL